MQNHRTRDMHSPSKAVPKTSVPPLVLIVGCSQSGKTTLLERLIPEFTRRGWRVGTIKHHHGNRLELDKPGKDSWRHKAAGASTSIVCSPRRIGMVRDMDHDPGPQRLLRLLDHTDIVLCEGYKQADFPKVEVFRSQVGEQPLCLEDRRLLAVVSDEQLDCRAPRFLPAEAGRLCEYIISQLELKRQHP